MKLTETKEGTIVEIFVKPNQPKFKIEIDEHGITVFCTKEPTKSKVNKELIKELSKIFHARIELVSGLASKQKQLLIRATESHEVERLLQNKGNKFA